MEISHLPAINAVLNGLSASLLTAGYVAIRRKQVIAHRNFVLGACATSALFLIGYITYHVYAGRTVFRDPAWFRPIYLVILVSHTILAGLIVPLVLITLTLGLRNQIDIHRRLARWTFPLWLYVSVTGVIIYFLLYQIFPQVK